MGRLESFAAGVADFKARGELKGQEGGFSLLSMMAL
jgi:hypothetical protein